MQTEEKVDGEDDEFLKKISMPEEVKQNVGKQNIISSFFSYLSNAGSFDKYDVQKDASKSIIEFLMKPEN